MKRINWLLALIVLLEFAVGAVLYLRLDALPRPPVPVLAEPHALRSDFQDLAADCQSLDDWHELAEVYTAYGFYPESEACYEFLLVQRPDDPKLLFESGFLLSQMGRCSDAHDRLIAALEAGHPEPQDCWYFIGLNFLRAEQPDKAAEALSQAGDLVSAQLELARLRYRAGDAREAMQMLGPVLEQEPDKIEPNTLAYLCALELGETPLATRYSEQAAATSDRILGPFYTQWIRLEAAMLRVGYRHRLGTAQARAKKNRQRLTEATFQDAMAIEWNEFSASSLAELAELNGDYRRAAKLWQEIVDRRGPTTISLARLADNYLAMNDIARAVDLMKQAVEAQSEEDLTEAYGKLARWSEVLERYEEADRYAALHTLWSGKLAFWRGDWRSAESHLTAASKHMDESDEVWFFLAETYRRLNKHPPALASYQRCLSLNPQHGGAHRGISILAEVYSTTK